MLSLQERRTEAHDELQFIVIHQAFELWFKLLLFELESTRTALFSDDVLSGVHLLRRVHAIVRMLTAGWPVIETMRPIDFLEFRSELKPASGFQSVQFREIECLSGVKDARFLQVFSDDHDGAAALRARLEEPTLWDAFLTVLRARGLPAGSDEALLQTLVRIARRELSADLYELAEALLEYDLLFSAWRQRHVLMAERMIGSRPGTGEASVARVVAADPVAMPAAGVEYFSGVPYLKGTVARRFFPLLWEARTFVER
jgi:tryptophan 2,3-dioxygenase